MPAPEPRFQSATACDLGGDPPRFEGEADPTDDAREVTLAEPTPRQRRADRLRRLQARAALFASPETCCSATEFADVMGMREGDARCLQPAGLTPSGRSRRAPFRAWLDALHCRDVANDPEPAEIPAPRPVKRPRHARPRTLKPLGGHRR
ncbi:MAG: hypothetical protein H6739_34730 [Alphaproteobacteria bacterium]|nr:hypothetical protein [Alphaproteobacteria bacterium]